MSATQTIPEDLIGLAEAAALLPGRKSGKKVSTSTIYRWAERGKLRRWRLLNREWRVSRAEVLALIELQGELEPVLASRRQREKEIRESEEYLRQKWG
jgi:excisionase family DNA binding protein